MKNTGRTAIDMARFCAVISFLAAAAVSWGEYRPPNGADNIPLFLSPSFLAGSPSVTSTESPQSDALNPASSGAQQRVTLDLSYLALADLQSGEGWAGHVLNLGNTIPTKFGVFSWSAHFLHSPLAGANLGTFGAVKGSFAKDLYPDLLVGIGVNAAFGHNEAFDWSLTGDLGFIHTIPTRGLPDLRWGVVLRDFGKGFDPVADRTAYPAPFTLATGLGFSLIKTPAVDLGLTADLSFPSFQNARLSLGTHLSILDVVGLQVSTTYDAREIFDPAVSMRSLIPSFGVSVTLKTDIKEESDFLSMAERGWGRSEVKTQAAAGPLQPDVWAFGLGANVALGLVDRDPPVVVLDYPQPAYISPNNDGVQDDLILPLTVTDARFVRGYVLEVKDESGTVIRTIQNKDERPENEGFRNVLDRLLAVKKGIPVPEALRWDGYTEAGAVAPDGAYRFTLKVWDDNGNVAVVGPKAVSVDATVPEIVVEQPDEADRVFSPNADGYKDTITIRQRGSREDLWTAVISSQGGPVRTITWKDGSPTSFRWDGTDDAGVLVPDGVYEYRISATDRAGNTARGSIQNVIVNTEATPIQVGIGNSVFSPNGDGRQDTLDIHPQVPVKSGVSSWTLSIVDSRNERRREYRGGDTIPEKITFDGRDADGTTLEEGQYHAALSVIYLNGNRPREVSPPFTVDLTPPIASVTSDLTVFSPNGDGNKDTITFFQESSEEEVWTGEILNARGAVIYTVTWLKTADPKFTWDGIAAGGLIAPDGEYRYRLSATDKAGNRGGSPEVRFHLNTEETPLLFSREFDAFSPNGDGVRDVQNLFPQLTVWEGIDSYRLTIHDRGDRIVRTVSGRGGLEKTLRWDGFADSGSRAPDGTYYAKLEVTYTNGNQPSGVTRPFVLDTVFPTIEVRADKTLFSPNGDGNKDTVTFSSRSSSEDLWEARIVDSKDATVRQIYWKGVVSTFVWDGTDEAGNLAPDGAYQFIVSTTDAAGNFSKARSAPVVVDNRVTRVFVTADRDRFAPNGDGQFEEITFNVLVNLREGIASWRLDILSENGALAKRFEDTRIPQRVIWDGRMQDGVVREGRYRAVFTVTYEKGDVPRAETPYFLIDVSPPQIDLFVRPTPFSPDNDGIDDELVFTVNVTDQSQVKSWTLAILDARNRPFRTYSGEGTPSSRIVWDGRSDTGELVMSAEDYPYVLTVEDVLGNRASAKGVIPVDVLVIREGNNLKIRIASITFEANSPSLESRDAELIARNERILDRIAGIFRKYSTYNVRIEGHAVSVLFADPVRAKVEQDQELVPLSEARALTVKQSLVARGISADRILVVGIGGAQPVVPHSDLENRWKNRRVEFILLK